MLEHRNYYNDRRVRAAERNDGILEIDERRQMMRIDVGEDDDGAEIEAWVHFKWEVCDTCEGKGSHVNPSIDCGGLSREDFDEDPDFEEGYFSGRYDVRCYGCDGRRVTAVPDPYGEKEKAWVERYDDLQSDRAEFDAISRAERMMGA